MLLAVTNVGDLNNAEALKIIMTDSVGHKAVGKPWFDYVSGLNRLYPVKSWDRLVTQYFNGDFKTTFNHAARSAAEFSFTLYEPLAERCD